MAIRISRRRDEEPRPKLVGPELAAVVLAWIFSIVATLALFVVLFFLVFRMPLAPRILLGVVGGGAIGLLLIGVFRPWLQARLTKVLMPRSMVLAKRFPELYEEYKTWVYEERYIIGERLKAPTFEEWLRDRERFDV